MKGRVQKAFKGAPETITDEKEGVAMVSYLSEGDRLVLCSRGERVSIPRTKRPEILGKRDHGRKGGGNFRTEKL